MNKDMAKFQLDDVDSLLSSRSGKRPLKSPEAKPHSTRSKSVVKKRKLNEPEDPIAPVEKRIHDLVTLVRTVYPVNHSYNFEKYE